jgi:hypothetical protein
MAKDKTYTATIYANMEWFNVTDQPAAKYLPPEFAQADKLWKKTANKT